MAKRTTIKELRRMQTSLGNVVAKLQYYLKQKQEEIRTSGATGRGFSPAELETMIKSLRNEIAVLNALETQISRVKSMVGEIDRSL